jgi:hypothetical protein
MANTLQIKRSTTAGNVPQLAAGELGANLPDNTLYVGQDAYTKLLIHSDNADGSSTFKDASPSWHTVTKVGDPTHETEQKKFGASSLYFDGSDALNFADHADWNFGSGAFTVDCWINFTTSTGSSYLGLAVQARGGGSGSSSWWFGLHENKISTWLSTSGSGWAYSSDDTGPALNDGSWHHLAWVGDGTNVKGYVDGTLYHTITQGTLNDSTRTVDIGASRNSSDAYSGQNFLGYMDEVRVSKGIARWTTTFTPPTRRYGVMSPEPSGDHLPLSGGTLTGALEVVGNVFANVSNSGGFMVTGASNSGLVRNNATGVALRTNSTDRLIVDNAGDVTLTGALGVEGSTKLTGGLVTGNTIDGLPDAHTKLLIHSDTHDGSTTFTDSSGSGHTVTATNVKHKVAQSKFGSSSMFFDGSGDFLTLPDSTDWDFGSGDFTLEAWINLANISTYHMIMCQDNNSGQLAWHLRTQTTGALLFRYSSDGTEDQTDLTSTASVLTINTWHHVAFVRSSNTYAFYVDGVQKGTGSITATLHSSTTTPIIGVRGGNSLPFEGYMDEVRISRTARWTAAFTPPTRAYSYVDLNSNLNVAGYLEAPNIDGKPDKYTKLLIHSDTTDGRGTFTDSSPSGHAITNYDVIHSTTKSKFGATSLFISDELDRLRLADSPDWDFGTEDWTIDCWVNPTTAGSAGSWGGIVTFTDTTRANSPFLLNLRLQTTGRELYLGTSGGAIVTDSNNTIPLTTWTHVAAVRSGDSIKLYINGVLGATSTGHSGQNHTSNGAGIEIGSSWFGYSAYYWDGYIDEFRISKGIARWTAAFTPPTRPYATFSAGDGVFTGELLTPRLLGSATTNFDITTNTKDGADNKRVRICGGGAADWDRGAGIQMLGNEYPSNGASLFLQAGNAGSGDIRFATGGADRVKVSNAGVLYPVANGEDLGTTGNRWKL